MAITAESVRFGYRGTEVIRGVSFAVPEGAITCLLGRNGSGKTTLLSILAGLRRPTEGTVLIDGEDPFENERVMGGIRIIRESGDILATERIATNLRYFAAMRPDWDAGRAEQLIDAFELDPRKHPMDLSRGQRSALGVVIGLATRAPLTIFDEVHLGMDAPSRQRFYDELLADVVAHPRTVVLSSHLIAEIEHLLERVVILDRGRVLLAAEAESLRSKGVSVTGPRARVESAVDGLRVVARRDLGPTRQVTVFDELGAERLAGVSRAGLELGPVPLQDLFIHLTDKEAR